MIAVARALEASEWKDWETFSPHPVEGIRGRANVGMISRSALIFGLVGLVAAMAMQWIPTVVLYPLSVGGKPMLSLPAFLPIAFESTILFSVIGALGALLFTARLPCWYRPLFEVEEFRKVSRDAYFVIVYCDNPQKAADFLTQFGAEHFVTLLKEEER